MPKDIWQKFEEIRKRAARQFLLLLLLLLQKKKRLTNKVKVRQVRYRDAQGHLAKLRNLDELQRLREVYFGPFGTDDSDGG